MSGKESEKKRMAPKFISSQQKKERADRVEEAINIKADELYSWVTMIETMDDKQLEEYFLNQPSSSGKTVKEGSSSSVKTAEEGLAAAGRKGRVPPVD